VRLTADTVRELDEIAMEHTEPMAHVSRSAVIREAIKDYLEKPRDECLPDERGTLEVIDVDEGAA
jgi:metal-responsive CopG/Arc/MetJ family transcriptional regulator